MTYDVVCADVMEWAAGYEGEPFHTMLTDVPYEYGFMGKSWDNSGISYQVETWAALAEHLLPGAFLMTFGGARSWHRIACAIENAGWIMQPSIFCWATGQGFPKSTRISKNGNHPEWQGHRYGLQAMKPAVEPILLFQKPWEGKRLDCIVETGAGALNVDGGRIGIDDNDRQVIDHRSGADDGKRDGIYQDGMGLRPIGEKFKSHNNGRWPANFALCHSPDCVRDGVWRVKPAGGDIAPNSKGTGPRNNKIYGQDNKPRGEWMAYKDADGRETIANWECVEGCPVRRLGEQSGELKSCMSPSKARPEGNIFSGGRSQGNLPMDKGTAARFFHQADWAYEVAERLAASDAVRYQAKAGRKERDAGLDGMPANVAHVAYGEFKGTSEHATNMNGRQRNNHPCCKPIALTQWLATLLLPPDAYAPRRILIPFAGSGSEAIGAMLAGWEHITLVEMNSDYCDIAHARLAWWEEQVGGQMWPDVKQILKNAK